MTVVIRGVSKRERVALKSYIDDIYCVNGAVFLEVNDKRKVRKALEKRGFDNIIPRSGELIVLPYHEGVRFYTVYQEFIEEYINPNWKPTLWEDIPQMMEFYDFKNFTTTMIIRKGVNYFSLQNKSLMFITSMLLSRIGLNTKINLRHNQVRFYGNGVNGQVRYDPSFEITSEHYKKYGWLFRVEKLNKESPFYYDIRKINGYQVPVFMNLNYSKNDNYITTIDNYESVLNEFQGLQWLSKVYSHVSRRKESIIRATQSLVSGLTSSSLTS